MLRVVHLKKRYKRTEWALNDVSFRCDSGQIVSLLGHNGAGKTTTLRIVAGILAPTAGSINIDGMAVNDCHRSELSKIRRQIGFCPESTDTVEYLTPAEYLTYVGQLFGISDESTLKQRVDDSIGLFEIPAADLVLIRELSSGQKKRLSLASALVNHPRLLLLDEPTNNLDPVGVKLLKEELLRLRGEGVAVVIATHRLEMAEELSDRVVVLEQGQIITQGAIGDLVDPWRESRGNALEEMYVHLLAEHRK